MRKRIAWLAVTLGVALAGCDFSLPAFPGAEGFGATTPGGRGGRVLFVTTLADAGPGSLREALAATGPRVVMFRVAGTITLASPLVIANPWLTVAGQSAPGGGIQIRNDPVSPYGLAGDSFPSIVIDTHDVVLRYLRVRPGPLEPNPGCSGPNALAHPEGFDTCVDAHDIRAIQLLSQARAVVLDHLSLAWSSDEIVALAGAQDVTLSWSLLAEGMDYVQYEGFFGAPVDAHGHGIILGDRTTTLEGAATRRISLHHNLWAHVTDRPPQLTGTCSVATPSEICTVDAVNNVAYNWRKGGLHVSNVLGHTFANIEGNTFRGGPDTPDLAHAFSLNDWRQSAYSVVPFASLRVHLAGNLVQLGASTLSEAVLQCNRWNLVTGGWDSCAAADYETTRLVSAGITRSSAEAAFAAVLADAGASRRATSLGWRASRDTTDARVVSEVESVGGGIIDSYAEFPGWPSLASGAVPRDDDADGMPNGWESSHCLDPALADDARDADLDGYTNLEEYLNATPPSACP